MEKISIAIETRVSLTVLELALRSVLDGSATPDYFKELASSGCSGANRAKKSVTLLNRLTYRSKLLPYLLREKDNVNGMLRSNYDRPLLFVAVMSAAYSLFYDIMSLLGKYFHAQDEVSKTVLIQKLSEKYGSNRSLYKGYDCVVSMLLETGIIKRVGPGMYRMVKQEKFSSHAFNVYKQAFLLNNTQFTGSDAVEDNPFFEFIR